MADRESGDMAEQTITTGATSFAGLSATLDEARAKRHEAERVADALAIRLLEEHRGFIASVRWDTPMYSEDDGSYGSGIGGIELQLGNGITICVGDDARMSASLEDYMEHIEGHIESDVPDERLVGFLLGIPEEIVAGYLTHLQTYIEEHMYDRKLVFA
jgi:hypothetical protein